MALSESVKENLLDAQGHLRAALKSASVNEKSYICKHIADILHSLDNLEKAEELIERIENRKFGDSGQFGPFFTDLH